MSNLVGLTKKENTHQGPGTHARPLFFSLGQLKNRFPSLDNSIAF